MNIFPADTATKLIESLTGVLTANMPIIIALLGFTLGVGLGFEYSLPCYQFVSCPANY